MTTQPLAGVDPASGNPGSDAARVQGTAELRRVVGLVRMELGRALARTPGSPARPNDGRDGIDEREQLSRVVRVGRGEADRERDAVPIHREVILGAQLATIRRVRAGRVAPLFARTLRLSTLARLQSPAASSPNQFSSVSCRRSHTLAACQSRSRRQQVVPLPQPSSLGKSRHGQPVRRTKTMPPRAARSGMRGRPVGLGGSCGSRGSIASQRSSGTRVAAFMARHHATPPQF